MRQLMIFAVVLVVLGGVAARYADQAVSSPPQQTAVVQPAYEPREPTTSGRSLMLAEDRLGHFQVEARPRWCFPTKRSQKTCSACPSCRGSNATNMPMDV